jgi:hypothetical protein
MQLRLLGGGAFFFGIAAADDPAIDAADDPRKNGTGRCAGKKPEAESTQNGI